MSAKRNNSFVNLVLRTVFFWVISRREVVILTDVSRQPIGPIFRGQ